MAGVLYGVSTGPGDPELITLKAVRIIERCGTIAVPRTKGENMLALSIAEQSADLSGKKIIYIDFPMTRDKCILDENYGRAAEVLCVELESNDVAMLSLGDISVYSTFGYVAERVSMRGFRVEICPGVTSFCAASSSLGQTLVQGSGQLHIIPYDCDDFEECLDLDGTKVIMKTGRRSRELIEILRRRNLLDKTSAVENCGLESEKVYFDIEPRSEEFGYFTVFIIRP